MTFNIVSQVVRSSALPLFFFKKTLNFSILKSIATGKERLRSNTYYYEFNWTEFFRPGVDLGGGGGGALSGIRPPADPKGPPLYYFEISIFGDGP